MQIWGWVLIGMCIGIFVGHAIGYARAKQAEYWRGVERIVQDGQE